MFRRILLISTVLFLSSCTYTTNTSTGSAPQLFLTYCSSGGITGYGVELEITTERQAYAWSLTKTRDLIGQRQLSKEEFEELDRLMARFAEYDNTYGHVIADGVATSITAEVDGSTRTVTVYNSKDAAPPESWGELVSKLQRIINDLREGV